MILDVKRDTTVRVTRIKEGITKGRRDTKKNQKEDTNPTVVKKDQVEFLIGTNLQIHKAEGVQIGENEVEKWTKETEIQIEAGNPEETQGVEKEIEAEKETEGDMMIAEIEGNRINFKFL